MTNPTHLDLDAMRARAREARERGYTTSGDWQIVDDHSTWGNHPVAVLFGKYYEDGPTIYMPRRNATYIIYARENMSALAADVLALADEVERLRERVRTLEG